MGCTAIPRRGESCDQALDEVVSSPSRIRDFGRSFSLGNHGWDAGEAAAALDSSTGFFRLAYPPTWLSLTLADSIAVATGAIFRRAESIH
jgi:hypothetical protein